MAVGESAVPPVTMPDNVATEPRLLRSKAQDKSGPLYAWLDAGSMRDLHATLTPPCPKSMCLKSAIKTCKINPYVLADKWPKCHSSPAPK